MLGARYFSRYGFQATFAMPRRYHPRDIQSYSYSPVYPFFSGFSNLVFIFCTLWSPIDERVGRREVGKFQKLIRGAG